MARIEEIERRLLNWARVKLGTGGPLGISTSPIWRGVETGSSGYRESAIPTMDHEAAETELAVSALEQPLQATVRTAYLHAEGDTVKAALLGITPAAMHARVQRAHVLIQCWLVERTRARVAERERVEAAIYAVRQIPP